ncbi:hypothetical protein BAE44_0010256 [Dichanthelium oligosanthes]|uniref:TFIIS N-terminal domain-containing protein n=1 Tax=Dichanthelium oligosanthes TaxID=888268 RepID=A0A1E5VUC1_9POAL|nr:hypothetical protein BAE44_0010256 [Dichanthelium oligosanthes]
MNGWAPQAAWRRASRSSSSGPPPPLGSVRRLSAAAAASAAAQAAARPGAAGADLGAFQHIDAAIEAAADGLLSRDEFRSARSWIVEMLCECDDATDGGGEKAECLCALLDEAMAGSLATLRAVPAERFAPRVLASSGDLVGAVGALVRGHGSERVRGLALDVVRGWRAGGFC